MKACFYVELRIPIIPPSPNELKRKYRNPHVYKKLRTVWENSIFISTGSAGCAWTIKENVQRFARMSVSITICHRGSYDPDNLVGSVKVCLDAMRNIGFLRNDRAKDIDLHVNQDNTIPAQTIIVLQPATPNLD